MYEDQKIINTKRVLYSITREPVEEKGDAENPFRAFVNIPETFVRRIMIEDVDIDKESKLQM